MPPLHPKVYVGVGYASASEQVDGGSHRRRRGLVTLLTYRLSSLLSRVKFGLRFNKS